MKCTDYNMIIWAINHHQKYTYCTSNFLTIINKDIRTVCQHLFHIPRMLPKAWNVEDWSGLYGEITHEAVLLTFNFLTEVPWCKGPTVLIGTHTHVEQTTASNGRRKTFKWTNVLMGTEQNWIETGSFAFCSTDYWLLHRNYQTCFKVRRHKTKPIVCNHLIWKVLCW